MKKRNNNSNRSSGKPKAMKYEIRADIKVNGTVQRKDIIGAIMGQTEGLLGDDLELRKLQRTARVGHVDVEMDTKNAKKAPGRSEQDSCPPKSPPTIDLWPGAPRDCFMRGA